MRRDVRIRLGGLAVVIIAAVFLFSAAANGRAEAWAGRPGQAVQVRPSGHALRRQPKRCATNQLSLRRVASATGLGNVSVALSFVDDGRRACTIQGWPDLRPLTARGYRGPVLRTKNPYLGVKRDSTRSIELKPGEAHDAFVIAGDDNAAEGHPCGPPYRRFVISLPGQSGQLSHNAYVPYLARDMLACAGLEITPVVPRSDLIF